MGDILHFRGSRDFRSSGDFRGSRDFRAERLVAPEPLWREALGRSLRAIREEQGGRLIDIAERAGISPQYLSEIERGRKEPSSEMIAAVTGALGVDLPGLLINIAGDVRDRLATGPVIRTRPTGPVLMAA
jgi:DNA-binding XRE family transcriptional regulator